MAKRVAEKQLTLENFEEEEEREDLTTSGPQIASKEVLKTRTLAKVKRRSDLNSSNDSIDDKKRAFSGFKGFGANIALNPISSVNPFQSLSQTTGNTLQTTQLSQIKPLFSINGKKTENKPEVSDSSETDSLETYHNKLSELNHCFENHVKTYMEKSRFYDFTQVCREYIEYHNKIESVLNDSKKQVKTVLNVNKDEKSEVIEKELPTIEVKTISSTPSDSQNSSSFGFQTQSQSIFGSSSTPSPISSQASANQSTQPLSDVPMFAKPAIQSPFSQAFTKFNTNFKNSPPVETATVDPVNEEDTEEPPKVESVVHKEKDALLIKKCKLFYKKGDKYVAKGLGYLYIKKGENESNSQLLIRADTTVGNILLNISLVESIPVNKANEKQILISCIPNPPLDPKAKTDIQTSVTFLIRVKTAEDCDELYNSLMKYKSSKSLN